MLLASNNSLMRILTKQRWLILSLIIFLITACKLPQSSNSTEIELFKTRTTTPTSTPTPDCPQIAIDTPSPIGYSKVLVVALFDRDFDYSKYTSLAYQTMEIVLSKVGQPGDKFIAIELGNRSFDNSFITIQKADIYYGEIIPPSPTSNQIKKSSIIQSGTPKPGSFQSLVDKAASERNQISYSSTATQSAFEYICLLNKWKLEYEERAMVSEATRAAIVTSFVEGVHNDFSVVSTKQPIRSTDEPSEILEGLSHASRVFKNECGNFNRCVLIIFSDLYDWRFDQSWYISDKIDINFSNIDIVTVMFNCNLTYMDECEIAQKIFYNFLFKKSIVTSEIPLVNEDGLNDEGLEEYLIHFIRK